MFTKRGQHLLQALHDQYLHGSVSEPNGIFRSTTMRVKVSQILKYSIRLVLSSYFVKRDTPFVATRDRKKTVLTGRRSLS